MPRDFHPHPADVAQHRADAAGLARAGVLFALALEELASVDPAAALEPREVIDAALCDARERLDVRAYDDRCLTDIVATPLPEIDMVDLARRAAWVAAMSVPGKAPDAVDVALGDCMRAAADFRAAWLSGWPTDDAAQKMHAAVNDVREKICAMRCADWTAGAVATREAAARFIDSMRQRRRGGEHALQRRACKS